MLPAAGALCTNDTGPSGMNTSSIYAKYKKASALRYYKGSSVSPVTGQLALQMCHLHAVLCKCTVLWPNLKRHPRIHSRGCRRNSSSIT
mmetsp:Transcript_70344/g.139481  ORF Transcript_70344/g.139481 Transcript_70344/m.139481 type:complete len:89 (+) Transcript_70344:63-329(+)